MTRPDPALDLVGSLRWIMDKIEAQEESDSKIKLSASDAARSLGYKPNFLHGKPWRIPTFGLTGKLHTLGEWKAWLDRPEAERRAEWDTMGIKQRRKALGAA